MSSETSLYNRSQGVSGIMLFTVVLVFEDLSAFSKFFSDHC